MRKCVVWLVGTAFLLSGCKGPDAAKGETAPAPEFRVDATIKDIMDSMVDPSADYIWDAVASTVTAKGVEEKYPRTDEEWKEVRRRAVQVMEASNLLLIPGRRVARPGDAHDPRIELPPERIEALINEDRAAFTKMAHALYDSVLPALKAIDAKNKDALLDAGDGMDQACENCHMKYWYPKK